MGCCGLRGGVITIGVMTMVAAVLSLGLVMLLSYLLTQLALGVSPRNQSQPHAAPPTATREPRTLPPVQGELSHLSDEDLANWIDMVYTSITGKPLNDHKNNTNETETDEDQYYHQIVESEGNDSETSTAQDTRNESNNERSKSDISSSKDDRFPTATSDTNGNERPSGRETADSFAFSKDSPTKLQTRSVDGSSTDSDSVDQVDRSLQDRLRRRRDSLSCEGPELEALLLTVSSMSAQQTAIQTTAVVLRMQKLGGLFTAWLGLVLTMLLLCGFLNVLSFGSGVLLIVGVRKGRPELFRPWRHLTVVSCALMVGLQVLGLGACLALNAVGEEVAARNTRSNAISTALCVVCLCFAGYFYWVVVSYERQLRNEQEEKCQNDNIVEKQSGNIYSCRI